MHEREGYGYEKGGWLNMQIWPVLVAGRTMVLLRSVLGWPGREREGFTSKSHISLWEHSSHFRLIGRGVPSVSVVPQLMYKFLCLASPKENPQVHM
jgi:hypothetical protein